jgi:energy-coupling factor transporter ATP-binding protein EcfA2
MNKLENSPNLKKEIIQTYEDLSHNKTLFDSVGKDIIVFIGNTGCGKSTLINFLSGKPLEVINANSTPIGSIGGDIVLKNPEDSEALIISSSCESSTQFPKYIKIQHPSYEKNVLLYDFPGFGDTRGLKTNIINAYLIKNIIEKAKSVKFAFVSSYNEIKSERGKPFKELLSVVQSLFIDKLSIESSCLIITKCLSNDLEKTKIEVKEYLKHDLIEKWINNNLLSSMSIPFCSKLNEKERENILNLLLNRVEENYHKKEIDMSSSFKDKEKDEIEKLIIDEIKLTENLQSQKVEEMLEKFLGSKNFPYANIAFDDFYNTEPTDIFSFEKIILNQLLSSTLIKILYSITKKSLYEAQKEFIIELENKKNYYIEKFKIHRILNREHFKQIILTRIADSNFGCDTKGTFVDDKEFVKNGEPITAWEIYHGGAIDSIRFKYGDIWGNKHGGGGGRRELVYLNNNEKIVSVFVSSGFAVYRLNFTTSENRTFLYGKGSGKFRNNDLNFQESLAYITSMKGNWYFYTFDSLVSSLSFYEAPFR